MAYGFASWDASGVPNNYGIKPISVIDNIRIETGVNTGSWTFNVPAGFKIGVFEVAFDYSYNNTQRFLTVTRNTVSISGSGSGNAIMSANGVYLTVFLEKE